jgi:hypothetical protein
MYYNARVEVVYETDKGAQKKKSENYLVNALSVTEAEAIVNQHFKQWQFDFTVKSVTETRFLDVLNFTKKS